MSYHKSFLTSDIKSQLKDYRKVRDFSKVKRGEFLKYLVKCDDDNREMYEYRTGGYLKLQYPKYVVLESQGHTWSVQKKNHIFFYKKRVNKDGLKRQITLNNSVIKDYGGKKVRPVKFNDEVKKIKKDNQDIFSNLACGKKPRKKNIMLIKKRWGIKGWEYITNEEIEVGKVIRHVSLDGKQISSRGMITDIALHENGTIRNITLYNNDGIGFRWKIRPHNYYLFLHPNSAIVSALFIARGR